MSDAVFMVNAKTKDLQVTDFVAWVVQPCGPQNDAHYVSIRWQHWLMN